MSEFLRGQQDYAYFLYGFGLILLAAICFTLRRSGDERLPWTWLGVYGLVHGLNEWLSLLSCSVATNLSFLALRTGISAASFLFLLEFGRLSLQKLTGRTPARWILLPVLSLSALGALDGLRGVGAAMCYALCLPGGVISATALLSSARGQQGRSSLPLALAGLAMALHTLLTGLLVPKASFLPASLMNHENFLRVTGCPVHLLGALFAMISAAALWTYSRSLRETELVRARRPIVLHSALVILVLLAGGWVVTWLVGYRSDAELRHALLSRATTAASALDPALVRELSGVPTDVDKPAFGLIRRHLKAMRRLNPDSRFIYLMTLRRGAAVFVADAEPVESDDYSSPGEMYSDATPELLKCLATGEPFTEMTEDSFGVFVSGLAGVYDPATHDVMAVLGMDIDGSGWVRTISRHRLFCIVITLLLCLLALTFLLVLDEAERLAVQTAASERRYRALVESSPNWIMVFDADCRCISSNEVGPAAAGIPTADAVGRCLVDFWLSESRPGTEEAAQQVLAGARSWVEVRSPRAGGGEIVWRLVLSPVGEDVGPNCRFVSIAMDISELKDTENALRQSEENYRTIFDAANDAIFIHDSETGCILDVNQGMCDLYGYPAAEVRGMHPSSLSADGEDNRTKDAVSGRIAAATSGEAQVFEWHARHKTGRTFWVEVSLKRVVLAGKSRLIAMVRDIGERKLAEANLRIQTSAMNAASDQIVIADAGGRIVFVNPAFERETGYYFREVVGQNPRLLRSGKHDERFYSLLWSTILAGDTWHGEITNRRKDGTLYTEDTTITPVRNEAGAIQHFIAIKRNITEKKIYEERLDHLAHHDPLTGLPNRLLFGDRLTQRLAQARRAGTSLSVMFLDLDRFKIINDTLGHNSGDELLRAAAQRLRGCLRETDTLARMGGDEFTVIVGDNGDPDGLQLVAERILDSLSQAFVVDGHELFVTASIGASSYPVDGNDAETLVRNADSAMYRAKEQGRNNFQIYTGEMNASAVEQMTLENSLRKALEREEFLVYYQPRVDAHTGHVLGVEALVRWQHPELGLVQPSKFISLAEETGLIVPISEWVLRKACAQNKAWQDAGLPCIEVAVNISARQLDPEGLVDVVRQVLDESGLDSRYLDLELTESTIMQNPDSAAATLEKLKQMGLKISIDDFGTGYSSLSHLKRFQIDAVKIDRSFVHEVTTSPDDAAIAGAVVAMAHSLRLQVIAEGVETLEQLEFLRSLNADQIQGYFLSPPVPADDFAHFLRLSRGSDSFTVRPAA